MRFEVDDAKAVYDGSTATARAILGDWVLLLEFDSQE